MYGTTIENMNSIIEKARNRKDGVYTYRGVMYAVKGNKMRHCANDGKIFELCYGFLAIVGNYDVNDNASIRKKLKSMVK